MSLEAAAGKNPASHVGKTYHAIGYDIGQALIAETDATEATVRLLSSIGHPVNEPQVVHIETAGTADPNAVNRIAERCFDDWSEVTQRLIRGEYNLY
jgi:S-adenosylmethionine synthetase